MSGDTLRERLARLLYDEVRETCGGYVEPIEDDEPMAGGVTVDGMIDFLDLADAVLEKMGAEIVRGALGRLS